MMRGWPIPVLIAVVLASAAIAQDRAADPVAQLQDAKRAAVVAGARADALTRRRGPTAALAARIAQTEAEIAAAEARSRLVATLVAAQRERLAQGQAPAARLLAALQSLATRPGLAAVAQPGSIDDLVHVRAVLGATLPSVRARTQAVRGELDRTRALQESAALAARSLRDGRARLEAQRLALVRLEARRRLGGQANTLFESDRALALGEQARDLIGALDVAQDAARIEARLVTLPGPLLRPDDDGIPAPSAAAPPYRLPVAGRIVTGLGELSDAGVRARGSTLAVAPGALVVAPAAGIVRYAARFRDYGRVVVIDHGAGWTSALIGLARADVRLGQQVAAGAPVGRAGAGGSGGAEPEVTVELRRRGRPVDLIALLGR